MPGYREDRRHTRIFQERPVSLKLKSSPDRSLRGKRLDGKTRDICTEGLQVLTDIPLPPETVLDLGIQVEEAARRMNLTAVVRWSAYDQRLRRHRSGLELRDRSRRQCGRWREFVLDTIRERGGGPEG